MGKSQGVMICPLCGDMMFLNSTAKFGNTEDSYEVLRIFKCKNCGYKNKSSELVEAKDVEYESVGG